MLRMEQCCLFYPLVHSRFVEPDIVELHAWQVNGRLVSPAATLKSLEVKTVADQRQMAKNLGSEYQWMIQTMLKIMFIYHVHLEVGLGYPLWPSQLVFLES